MTPRHIEIVARHNGGESFQAISEDLGVSRARVQQLHAVEIAFQKAVLAAPHILTLRAHSPSGVSTAGWLQKFMTARQLSTRDMALKGSFWIKEQKGVGEGKVKLLAWALEVHGVISSAEGWLRGEACLK